MHQPSMELVTCNVTNGKLEKSQSICLAKMARYFIGHDQSPT